mmetsp:Transcript_39129/g.62491  ORF Transcript_39129/g.62491 Transcript_39129/m.62491 type:complete len:267 (+) Transcript_39129:84-884(+)
MNDVLIDVLNSIPFGQQLLHIAIDDVDKRLIIVVSFIHHIAADQAHKQTGAHTPNVVLLCVEWFLLRALWAFVVGLAAIFGALEADHLVVVLVQMRDKLLGEAKVAQLDDHIIVTKLNLSIRVEHHLHVVDEQVLERYVVVTHVVRVNVVYRGHDLFEDHLDELVPFRDLQFSRLDVAVNTNDEVKEHMATVLHHEVEIGVGFEKVYVSHDVLVVRAFLLCLVRLLLIAFCIVIVGSEIAEDLLFFDDILIDVVLFAVVDDHRFVV